ncbi:MAG: polymerase sigma factor [Flavipsychrobacter sp.]|nr:polymerase sigma factor [Flavipsychrobacter sp.]
MHQEQDDIAVIQQVLKGQPAAYAAIVSRYQAYVFTLVMRYVNNRELAEELSQDVFVKAYKYLADFKGNSKFSTWLYAIVRTTCLSHLRKKDEGVLLMEHDDIVLFSDRTGSAILPSDLLEQKMQQQLLGTAIKQLQEDEAQILTLFYQAEQTTDEIGIIMGLTTSNVKVRLYRARQKLKDVLESRYSNEIKH